MPWKVKFEREAEKELNRIDRQQAKRILKYLFERIASSDDPRRFGKALKQNLSGFWKYRVGNYRIICDIQEETVTALVLRVGHRSLAWRRYVPVTGPKSLVGFFAFGVGFGLVGLLVWCVPAVLIYSIVFAAGHTVPEWPAALAYSILISILWIIRKDLVLLYHRPYNHIPDPGPVCLFHRSLGTLVV